MAADICESILVLPLRAGIRALQMLHFGQHVPEMLGMYATLAVPLVRHVRRALESRLTQYLIDSRRPPRLQIRETRRDASSCHLLIDFVGGKQFVGEAPDAIESVLCTAVALFRAVAETNEPAGAEPKMVAGFLQGLGCDGRETRVGGACKTLINPVFPRGDEKSPHYARGEPAGRLHSERRFGDRGGVAKEGPRPCVATLA